jgi:hypothetical protein
MIQHTLEIKILAINVGQIHLKKPNTRNSLLASNIWADYFRFGRIFTKF